MEHRGDAGRALEGLPYDGAPRTVMLSPSSTRRVRPRPARNSRPRRSGGLNDSQRVCCSAENTTTACGLGPRRAPRVESPSSGGRRIRRRGAIESGEQYEEDRGAVFSLPGSVWSRTVSRGAWRSRGACGQGGAGFTPPRGVRCERAEAPSPPSQMDELAPSPSSATFGLAAFRRPTRGISASVAGATSAASCRPAPASRSALQLPALRGRHRRSDQPADRADGRSGGRPTRRGVARVSGRSVAENRETLRILREEPTSLDILYASPEGVASSRLLDALAEVRRAACSGSSPSTRRIVSWGPRFSQRVPAARRAAISAQRADDGALRHGDARRAHRALVAAADARSEVVVASFDRPRFLRRRPQGARD